MPTTPQQFERQLAAGDLRPVYLLAGDEHLLLLEAADLLRERARHLGYSERAVLESAESGFDWNELGTFGMNLSLFAQRRLIDLRIPTGKPGTEGANALKAYCAAPAADTVLLITCNSWSKAHETAWVAAVESVGQAVVFWPLKPREVEDWMMRRARQRGLSLNADAIALLASRAEGNLLAGAQEIDKLALLSQGKPLDAAAIDALVADHARFDVFALADAMLTGDSARALRIVRALKAEGEAVPGMVPWVSSQIAVLARVAQAQAGGMSVDSALRAQPGVWQTRFPLYKSALGRADHRWWEARLAEAAEVERLGKGRGTGDAWTALERLALKVAQPRRWQASERSGA